MKKLIFKKDLAIYFLAFVLILNSRLFWSPYVTPSITHDELIYAANAKSLSLFNHDVTNKLSWFSFRPIHHMYAEFPASFMAPFYVLLKNPLIASHAVPTIFSSLLPFIFCWISFSLFKNKKLSIITLLLVVIAPLNWQFSKLTYDAYFSLFFYFLGIAIYLSNNSKKSLLSLPIFFFGFFNYQGYKLILFPITLALYIYKYKLKNKFDIYNFLVPIVTLLMTLVYGLVILPSQDTSVRISQTIFTDEVIQEKILYDKRSISLLPIAGKFFSNKAVVIAEMGIDRLFGSINPTMLFLYGEPSTSGFAVWSHGFFYLIEFFLILIGIILMYQKKETRSVCLLLCSLFLFSLFPAIISTISSWYLLRSLFSYFVLYFFISFSVYKLSTNSILKYILIFSYMISVSNFAYQYYFRYPIYRSDKSELHEKVAVEYANRASKKGRVIIYDDEPHYLFFADLVYKDGFKEFQPSTKFNYQDFQAINIGNITFSSLCQDESEEYTIISSYIFDPCNNRKDQKISSRIVSIVDSGEKYLIYNDKLCKSINKSGYVRISKLEELSFEKLSDDEFCSKWIVR